MMIIVILGVIGWLMYLLIKFNALDLAVKKLTQEQLKIQQQLAQLHKNLPQDASNPAAASQALTPKRPLAEVINESLGADTPTEIIASPAPQTSQAAAIQPMPAATQSISPPIKPAPRPVIKPAAPRQPDLVDKIINSIKRFFTEGNPIVRIGMVVMFFGVSFLVKYASGQGLLPIEFRLTAVIGVAIALLVFGWKTRERPGGYGLVLQGGAIGVIYLTLFAAAKLYGLIPLGIAFGLLFIVVMLGVLLALLQNAQVLAILATAGGFLAPILTSSGNGSHVGLFSFYLILNLGILAIALHKAWRLLNWVGFIFTFVITAAWGVLKYDPTLYASTQPFLAAFFVLYLTVAILFSLKQTPNLKGMVDGSLVFGLPLIAFGLQTQLLIHTDKGLAISAVVLAVIYLALSWALARKYLNTHRVLIESFLALEVGFATLAVPLALDASWTSVTWALEATGLIWVGLRQERMRSRIVGYVLHAAAAFSLIAIHGVNTGSTPIISGDYLALALLATTSFTIAYLLHVFAEQCSRPERYLSALAIGLGLMWWFVANILELRAHTAQEQHFAAILLFSALTAAALMLASKKLNWVELTEAVFTWLPFLLVSSLIKFIDNDYGFHPLQGIGPLAFTLVFALHYRFLYLQEIRALSENIKNSLLSIWHILTAWWLFALMFWEVSWLQQQHNLQGTAGLMLWFAAVMVPAVALIGAGQQKCWPFISFSHAYKNWVPAPLMLLAGLWFFAVCHKTLSGDALYLPLLNPLDLAQFAVIVMFAYAAKRHFFNALTFLSTPARAGLLGVMVFIWANVVTLRAVSHYQDIDYEFSTLWDAMPVQMALSILWSLCALLVMHLSRRYKIRQMWMIGAGLLGLVVLKLATKDLAGSGTLAGIISFMVVGALMLLIGYLSPIPAKKNNGPEEFNSPEIGVTPASNKDSNHE